MTYLVELRLKATIDKKIAHSRGVVVTHLARSFNYQYMRQKSAPGRFLPREYGLIEGKA